MTISNISSFYKKRKLIISYLFFQLFAELKASIGITLRELVAATNKKWRKQYKYLLISYSAHKVVCKDNSSSFSTYYTLSRYFLVSLASLICARRYVIGDISSRNLPYIISFFSSIFDYIFNIYR